jgi:hypothetical protein
VVFSPDGGKGYVSLFQSSAANNVTVFSPDSLTSSATIDLTLPYGGGGPGNMVIANPTSGATLWVMNNSWVEEGFTVVDVDTDTVLMHTDIGGGGGSIPGACGTPDQSKVFIVLEDSPILVYDTTSLTQTHEYAEIPDNYDCIVAPDGRAFFVSDTTGVIHKIDIDSLEPVGPEPEPPAEETFGDTTSESGLIYTCSDCFACPDEDWYIADKAFDDDHGTTSNSWHTSWDGSPEWVAVDFGSGNEKTIRHYALMGAAFSASYCARDWQLQASHDGSSWDTLHTVSGAALTYVMWGGEPFTHYSFSNETAYQHWRVNVTGNMGGHELGIVEIEMMENLVR